MKKWYSGMMRFGWITLLLLLYCQQENLPMKTANEFINQESLVKHISRLASDEFEGRLPSTLGEDKTISYLTEEFKSIGLKPGNGNSFLQEVPLVEITAREITKLEINGGSRKIELNSPADFVAVTRRVTEHISLDSSQLVFAGYGIVAPEYHWNDYEKVDVTGKTVIVLVNDPGFARNDSSVFNGKAMTYYGRWTYKYEEAARQGAAAVLIIHDTDAAGYPWSVVENGWTGPQFYMDTANRNMSRCKVEGWLSGEAARKIFKLLRVNFDRLSESAAFPGFKPVNLGAMASISFENTIHHSLSHNVLAVLPGQEQADEYIIFTAHWDHFGRDSSLTGDQIYNGARDNATGTAALLVLAKAFSQLPQPPKRSLLFMPVTGEEQGLLGSAFYAENPVYPLNKTVAVINLDAMNIWGRMKDITVIGYGNSELDDYVAEAAKKQGRTVRPDPEPQKGGFYRSDHFSFAKRGVPALYPKMGVDHVQFGKEWTLQQIEMWTKNYYHKPADEYDPAWWDLSGCVDDLKLLFDVAYKLSMENKFPNWREGNEFRAIRDADMKE